MIRAIAIDPDPSALNTLTMFCQQLDTVTLGQSFTQADQARCYLRTHPVDLVFLETELPGESGLDFWQSIRQPEAGCQSVASPLMAVFTTVSRDHALASYDLQATDYLLKPLSFERFRQAIQRAATYAYGQQLATTSTNLSLSLRLDSGLVRVTIADILWIEALSNYLKIQLADQRVLVVRMTMKVMLQALPATDFVRVHRSYIVAIHQVKAIHSKLIQIGEKRLPLSPNYEADFYARLSRHQPSSPVLSPSSHSASRLQRPYANTRIAP